MVSVIKKLSETKQFIYHNMNSIIKKLFETRQFVKDHSRIIYSTYGLIIGICYSIALYRCAPGGSIFSPIVISDYHYGLVLGDAVILFMPILCTPVGHYRI